nr:response regulator transcription factor [Chitinophagaceae bacterium]
SFNSMPQLINCMVVDDNTVDRKTVISFLMDYPFIHISGEFESPLEAIKATRNKTPDAIFLDIDMPEMTGLELRQQLMHIPACIFITSYPDYAIEGFEMAALDFLVKPFSGERFAKTLKRLQEYIAIHTGAHKPAHSVADDSIFIKEGDSHVKLQQHEILYLEALKDYTGIITAQKKYLVLSPLGTLIKEKPFGEFIRIHRSYAVHRGQVKKIMPGQVIVHDITLPVGRAFKDILKEIRL